jgi:hypothetical protein
MKKQKKQVEFHDIENDKEDEEKTSGDNGSGSLEGGADEAE